MIRKVILFYILIGIAILTNAQVVVPDPEIPIADQAVTIYFDATKGTGGLKDYSGDVYAHTGVITDKSTSSSDWKYVKTNWGVNSPETKLTKISDNYYKLEITSSIKEYYGVPDTDTITQMAFVFRSDFPYTGSTYYEGKDDGGKDIFVEVFKEGLNINLISPEKYSLVVELNEQIEVLASASLSDSVSLFIDNTFITSGTIPTELNYTIDADSYGEFWAKVVAYNLPETVADSFSYFVRPPVTVEDLPVGLEPGINYMNDSKVALVLYAPNKSHVFAIGDFSDWAAGSANYMKNTPDGSTWWVELDGLTPGREYIYQYLVDDSLRIGDPYADKVSDPWNDHWIDNETYPDLIQYPNNKTNGVATVFQTAQQAYTWKSPSFVAPDIQDLVVYELLIRDFTEKHTYQSLIDTLGYLERLGVNAIELMPVNEFEGNESWGYNPSYYFAPDKYYGPKNDLKAFIDSCHSIGIAVIMDIVLNHSMSQSPLAMLYWDPNAGDWGQPSAENPWYNQVSPNPIFSWGSDFNHESDDTKAFVDRVNKYWLTEYNFDGFRFDFTKGFTNTPGDGGAFDQPRIDILKRMADKIWETNSDAYVILEHFAANNEETILSDYGMLLWGNLNHKYGEASMGWNDSGKSDFSWISYLNRGWNDPHVMGYMESHDEERQMFKNLEYGNSFGDYNIKEKNTALRRIELIASFFFTIPGPKMIWQFEELGYDVSIDDPCRVCNKPILWDYYQESNRKRIYQVFSALIDLKKNQEAFSTDNFNLDVGSKFKRINLFHSSMDVVVLGNFDVNAGSLDPDFSKTGKWYEYFSGDSLEITNVNELILMEAGEYRIYTTKRLTPPDITTDIRDLTKGSSRFNVEAYPNPVLDVLNVTVSSEKPVEIKLQVLDIAGREIFQLNTIEKVHGVQTFQVDFNTLFGQKLNKGVYIIKVSTDQEQQVIKIIKQ